MKTLSMGVSLTGFALMTLVTGASDKLPDRQLKTASGASKSIYDVVKQKPLNVISFWATWCVPCKKELENVNDMYADWQEDYDMQLIAISIDDQRSTAAAKSYMSGKGYDYVQLFDPNKDFFKALNGITPPLTIITDRQGNILDVHTGYVEGDEYELEEKLEKFAD